MAYLGQKLCNSSKKSHCHYTKLILTGLAASKFPGRDQKSNNINSHSGGTFNFSKHILYQLFDPQNKLVKYYHPHLQVKEGAKRKRNTFKVTQAS